MVFDAICYLEQRFLRDEKWMKPEQIGLIRELNDVSMRPLGSDGLGMSTLCLIVSAYTDNENLEAFTLRDLATVFSNADDLRRVVRERIKNQFQQSYVFPTLDRLLQGYGEKYSRQCRVLEEGCFETVWRERMLPEICREKRALEKAWSEEGCESIFSDIALLWGEDAVEKVSVFVSYMSFPTAFTLYHGSFLNCFGNHSIASTLAHELMHGFASEKVIGLYLNYIEKSEFLRSCHKRLIEDLRSGNEEELVMAAEYYLLYRTGRFTGQDLLEIAKKRYGGACPTSVLLFDLLRKEPPIPRGYDQWLVEVFEKNRLPGSAIQEYISEIV
jgi:hypothetical protein